jgi:hypothetical protein
VLPSGLACGPVQPLAYSDVIGSRFYAEANECYQATGNLTAEQEAIARFWSDDPGQTATPPGHSISILSQVTRMLDLSLARATEAYAKVGVAVADAFIACWNTKYRDNLLRPVTYIRNLIDPAWTPLLVTPPFPDYTSGHSVQSGAAAQVLTDLFGDVAFVDRTHERRGLPARSLSVLPRGGRGSGPLAAVRRHSLPSSDRARPRAGPMHRPPCECPRDRLNGA